MPTIPFPENRELPGVTPDAGGRTVPSVEALGGGAGAAALNEQARSTGRTLESLAIQAQRDANQIAVSDRDRQAAAIESSLLNDPVNGALSKRGQNAFAAYGATMESFDSNVSKLAATLSTEEQKAAFSVRSAQRRNSLDERLQFHVSKERRVYDDQVTASSIANETDGAMQAAGEPGYQDRVDLAAQRIREDIWQWGGRNGQMTESVGEGGEILRNPTPELTRKIREAESKLYSGVIANLLAKEQDQEAQAFYKDHQKDIDGSDTKAVLGALEEGGMRGASQRKADTIIETSKDEESALDKVKSIEDPKLRDETERRVEHHFNRKKALAVERNDDLYLGSGKVVDASPDKLVRDLVPPSVWNQMTPEDQKALERRRGVKTTDAGAWVAFLGARESGNLAEMSRADFERKYWSCFDDDHRKIAEDSFAAFKADSKGAKVTSTMDFDKRVDYSLRQSGLIPQTKKKSKFSTSESEMYTEFSTAASAAIENFELTELQGKRKATGTETQKVIDGLLAERVFIPRGFMGKEVPAVLVPSEDVSKAYVPVARIPEADKVRIAARLVSFGRPLDKKVVERAYAAAILGDTGRADAILRGEQ